MTSTEDLVSFLKRPEAYPDPPSDVEAIETHMSWVFLTEAHAYKLKKAVRQDSLDFSTPDLRRFNCFEEVRLNRRLALGVYLGVLPLTRDVDGALAVNGRGNAVDWLVHMRRLPANRNLEAIIQCGRSVAEEGEIREAARHLARFYAKAPAVRVSAAEHRSRLAAGVRGDRQQLSKRRYGLCGPTLDVLARGQLAFLEQRPSLFEQRLRAGRVVEGHGDLRPEHIWLDGEPAIIDCVEFDPALRTVDPADELAFLALECDRLGAPHVGRWFLEIYGEVTGDHPPAALLHFYRVYRALRRATIAARHLDDPSVRDPERFLARAKRYLEMVDPIVIDRDA